MAFEAKELFDALGSFPQGMNGGIDPILVPRNQLAYLENGTVRGDFAKSRSAYLKLLLDFGADTTLQAVATTNLYQGANYFKSDAGTESLIASIGGRLFQFKIGGSEATISELTGELTQSPAAEQCWLWQAEQFLIFNDGSNLPLFWDGTTLRRSYGLSTAIIGTVAPSGFTSPSVGATVAVPLIGPYTGPLGVNISIGSFYYQINSVTPTSVTAYKATLKNVSGGANETIASGTPLKQASGFYSFVTQFTTSPTSDAVGNTSVVLPVSAQPPTIGTSGIAGTVNNGLATLNGTFYNINGNPNAVLFLFNTGLGANSHRDFGVGSLAQANGNTYSTVAAIAAAFTDPTPGNSVANVQLSSPLTAAVNSYVFWGNPGTPGPTGKQAQITAYAVDNSVTYTATAINVNQGSGQTVAGGTTLVSSSSELPAGRMGAYGRGRNWMSLTDGKRFLASDIAGGSSGSAAYDKRDAVLKVTENNFLNGGGYFFVPGQSGSIRAMIFTATLDASLGQGPLAVVTPAVVFSCNAPVERAIWQDVTNPILTESMKAKAGLGQNSTILANSDVFMRAYDGIRSHILARREFNTWGNTAISREVSNILNQDDKQLLPWVSAIEFDNRLLMTCRPARTTLGTYFTGLIALNFDPISSLRGKAPSVYDGLWSGLNVLQVLKGEFAGVERAFAFCLNSGLSAIELWEILPTEGMGADTTDNGTDIVLDLRSGALNFGQNDPRKRDLLRLMDGEIFVDSLNSDATFAAYYKPDQWPDWVPWYSWTERFDANNDPGFRPRMGLGEPDPRHVDNYTGRPLREAYTYQFRLVVRGQCRFLGARFKAVTVPQTQFANPRALTYQPNQMI